ncbi:hypothetical protein BFG07_12245 [Kosakonia cowanii]|jgi:hypothetical protein|uniref:hypothetical protein n=1 Tax=Kosakonia cowanii TaxID=208223 RepID=UPI000B975D19|nr:hypothetical protein [Kosakonia cowanii]AST69385.1 hypothetical protein BFG07_12245 [Kosakonia cowanii]
MSYRFNLPKRFYFSLILVLLVIIYACNQTDDKTFKFTIKLISGVFFLCCIFSALKLRNKKDEPYKNILNTIWNIETAFVFIYAISLIYNNIIHGTEPVKNFTSWASSHPLSFVLLTHVLGLVAIARAAFSFTDIFKKSILKLHETKAEIEPPVTRSQTDTNA